ncbi:MAG: hypothetical protein PUD26_04040 [bacterium]|nr:hypothetical protein [bacterium]
MKAIHNIWTLNELSKTGAFTEQNYKNLKAIHNKYLKRIYLVPSGGFVGLNNDHIADFLDKKYCLGGYGGVWPGWGRNLFGGMKMKL